MKVNMLTGARFNGKIVSDALNDLDVDVKVYSSSPPRNWQNAQSGKKTRVGFVPLLSAIYEDITHVRPTRAMKDKSAVLFDAIASRVMRPCHVLHMWATFGLISARKQKRRGGLVVLDRACPHIGFQEELLDEEARRLGIPFAKSSPEMIRRCLEEYAIADQIVVPSLYSHRSFVERGISPDKLKIIRLDSNFHPRSLEAAKREGADGFVLGCVGGSLLRKGLVYLVEAWQSLKLPNARLLLKTPAEALMGHAETWRRITSDSSIEIVERQKDMESFYRRCDLFCLPSVDDGFGMVVLEAIACGVPAIVTRNVGAADLIQEGRTGYIVEARRADLLAEKIELLYRERGRLERMSASCLEYYREYRAKPDSYKSGINELLRSLA